MCWWGLKSSDGYIDGFVFFRGREREVLLFFIVLILMLFGGYLLLLLFNYRLFL